MKKESRKLENYAAFYSRQDETVVLMEAITLRQQLDIKTFESQKPGHEEALPLQDPSQPVACIDEEIEYDTHDFSAVNHSNLVTTDELRCLSERFPAKTFMKRLDLVYSSCMHGFSLKTLYNKCNTWCNSTLNCKKTTPCIFIISDTRGHTFGAVSSCIPTVTNKRSTGNGESMLFQLRPNIEMFTWTGRNDFFSLFRFDSISFGGSDKGGRSGIWIDKNLLHGRTMCCETFGNTVLSVEEDFEIYAVEVWSFTD